MNLVDKIRQVKLNWFEHKIKRGIAAASLAATMAVGTFSACKGDNCETDMDCTSDQLCEENACYSMAGGSCETDMDCLEGLVCENHNCFSQSEIADNTRLPENDPAFRSVEVSENELYFTFSVPAGQIGIQSGNVVVGASSGGYLRNVESIEIEGNSLRAFTSQASLTDAIENGSLRGVITFGSSNKSGDYAAREQSLNLNFSDEVLYNQNTGTGQYLEVRISDGSLSFSPELDLDVSFSRVGINRFSAIASGEIDLNIDVEASMGGRLEASREVAIGLPYVQPFAFSIGIFPVLVPVVGTATLQLYAGFSASSGMAGEVTVGFDCNASLEFGAVYSDGDWTEIWDPNMNCNAHSPELGIEGNTGLEMYLRPELRIMVYGVAGPALDVKPYLSWEGTFTSLSNWNWELAAGISGNLGYRLEVFGRGINRSFELFDWRNVIASDSSGGTTCSDECSIAGNYCSGDDAYSCTRGTDGCLDSRLIDSCTSNEHCESGNCVDNGSTCSDECSPYGNTRCVGEDTVEDCFTEHDTDSCLEWGYLETCGSEEHCESGSCVDNGTTCTNECSPAGNYCSGSDVYSCTRGTDGCLDSGYVTSCAEGCSGGVCNNVPADRFVNMEDGTVRDNDTGTIWQQSSGGIMDHSNAIINCDNLTLGGSSNWTLPDIWQLRDLVSEPADSSCLFNPIFSGSCNRYWSSTNCSRSTFFSFVDFRPGSDIGDTCFTELNTFEVRCIKY